jgi:pimeloyl-ACP methyl ester carboxylesterase
VAQGDLDHALTLGTRNFLRMPDAAIEEFRHSPVWSLRASMTPTWAREVRAIDAFGDDLDRFTGLTAPTLLVTGELSPPVLLTTSRRLHKHLPNGRLVEIPGHAHEAYLTAPKPWPRKSSSSSTTSPHKYEDHHPHRARHW